MPKVHTRAPIVMPGGANVDRHLRRRLIRAGVKGWIAHDPAHAKWIAKNIRELIKVDTGGYGNKAGCIEYRVPSDLWNLFRQIFEKYAPDLPQFGADDSDLKVLQEEFPRLVPKRK